MSEYVGSEYKHGGDIRSSILNESKIVIPIPQSPTYVDPAALTAAEEVAKIIFKGELDAFVKRKSALDDNIQKAYSLVIGQCTDLLQSKLKQQANWSFINTEQDAIGLITLIKTITFRFEDQKFLPLALYQSKANVYNLRQGNMTNHEHLQRFQNLVDVATAYNGQLHDQAIVDIVTERKHPGITYQTLAQPEQLLIQTASSELYLATMFIHQSDRRRCGKLSEDLENSFTKGNDDYPENLVSAYHLINEYKCWQPKSAAPDSSGVAFAQKNSKGKDEQKNKYDSWQKKATCHHCGKLGHIRPNCPALKDDDDKDVSAEPSDPTKNNPKNTSKEKKSSLKKKTAFAQNAAPSESENDGESDSNQFVTFGFCNTSPSPMNLRNMILLDNQSTVDLFCNRKLVSRVWKTDDSMTVHGNGGTLTTNSMACVENYGDVWFHPSAITNILSLKNVRNKFHVTYDSQGDSAFIVHKPNGTDVHFIMHADGLHYHDTKNRQLTMVSTVKSESEGHSKRQIEQAKTARDFQSRVGHPSTQDLKSIVKSNLIVNCPVTAEDIDRAEKIYGPSVPILKGKTTRQNPLTVTSDYVAIPPQILSANQFVTLSADLFFVNQVPFFATVSDHIKFTTAEHIVSRKSHQLVQASKHVQALYAARGFSVKYMLMDGEFVPIKHELASAGIILNTTSANEHVPKIERQIRVIKERVRATRHTLPFTMIPLTMLIELIYSSILWINAFPPKGGVSSSLSPRNIMTGIQFDYNKHCQLQFGDYVQAHQEPSPTNTQASRTVGATCLGPTGNIQGSYKFMNLRTGKRVTRRRWTKLPMPQEVIDRVNQLGKADHQPELLTFYDRKGRSIGDADAPGVPDIVDTSIQEPQDGTEDLIPPTVNDDYGIIDEPNDAEQPNDIDQPIVETVEVEPDPTDRSEPTDEYEAINDHGPDPDPSAQVEPDLTQPLEQTVTKVPDPGATEPRRSQRARLKPQRLIPTLDSTKSYRNTAAVNTKCHPVTAIPSTNREIYLIHPEENEDQNFILVAHYVMTQYSMKAGLKHFKERGEEAASAELKQLHWRDTFEPINPSDLTPEELKEVLESHMFLKEKRDQSVKGRVVAGGDKQRGKIDKLDASSPTAALESVLLTAVIDAHEGRDVAVIDIPNAFVQTRLEDDKDKAIMRLRGKLAELMVKVAPEIYTKYVIINKKGETVLYVRLLNALCGIMKAALLYYQRFVKDLKSIGFTINPYDPCVANKTVQGKQLTVVWHVDDLKVSHVNPAVVTQMADWLKKTYQRLFEDGTGEMSIARGKVHECLGMTLDFTVPGEVKITMIPCVKEIVKLFSEYDKSEKTAATPAAEHLFKVNDDAESLDQEQMTVYHNFVAKCLFLTKRSRPDISTAVAFLSTRVKASDVDDWKKLTRMIRYLRGSIEMPLILRADSVPVPKWWVDGSHATHPNMRGHSGGCMSLGKGMPINTSTKQKIMQHSELDRN